MTGVAGKRVRIAVIVPVAPFEPEKVVVESARWLKGLEYCGDVRILYVIDRKGGKDRRAEKVRELGVQVLERENTRGKRAGAINDGLDCLRDFNPDYVAIFDVDSRPEKNFVVENIRMLEQDEKAYLSSSPRRVSNPVNFVSKTVEVEYHLLNYLIKKNGYRQFNGLIGVLRAKFLYEHRLNEDVITEDADFSTRMHALGYRALYCENSAVYEQAPLSWTDLYNQRKRWYYGGLQLWRYRKLVSRSKNRKFKYSWYAALTLTYLPVLMIPFLLFLGPPLVLAKFRNVKKLMAVPGLVIHSLVLQLAAVSAVISFVRKRGVEWKAARRV